MAGTATMIVSDIDHDQAKYTINWTSDATGAVSGTSFDLVAGTINVCGFVPGAGGSQPTNLHDVTLICAAHGTDLLNEAGANLSNTVGEHRAVFMQNVDKTAFTRQWCHGGLYQLIVANAGDTKSGSVDLYIHYEAL